MLKISRLLLTSTILSVGLAAAPALAQSTGDESPVDQVEGVPPAQGDEGAAPGEPVETQEANAPQQEPAFPEQTRAPQPAEMPEVDVATFAEDLPQLWSMEFLPDGRMLVAAKEGAFHIVSEEGEAGPELEGMIEVDSRDQGGLLDVALAPDFESSNVIYFTFAEPRDGGNGTSLARATLALNEEGGGALENVETIWQQMPTYDGTKHYGSRIVFAPDGNLFIGLGERSDEGIREEAQNLETTLGKVVRLTPDGEPVDDNPFIDDDSAMPEIWSYGHRNIQSAALDAEGRLWTIEHGPAGGDELNMPEAGLNYGWPVITYGVEYSGDEVGEGITEQEGMEQPVYYWDPVLAPSGMALYEGEEFPEWENAFLVGGLVQMGITIIHLEDDLVVSEQRIPLDQRVRDVRVGPDGAVYVVTEDPGVSSAILRLTRADG